MTNPIYMRIPFGTSGDRTAVPFTGAADGPVNYTYGYGTDYSLPRSTDPAALNVERVSMNELFYDITSVLQQYQQYGVPWFITASDNGGSAFQYAKNAIVRYDDSGAIDNYLSTSDSNDELPTNPSYWAKLRNDPAYIGVENLFRAIQTIAADDVPLVVNSTNSSPGKIYLSDNYVPRGVLGATADYALGVFLSDNSTLVAQFTENGLDNTVIGALDPQYGQFSTLEINGSVMPTLGLYGTSVLGVAVDGALQVVFGGASTTVNYLTLTGGDSGQPALISSQGILSLTALSNQSVLLNSGGGKSLQANYYSGSGTPVNYIQTSGAGTGFGPILEATGTDSNATLVIAAKGTGEIWLSTNGPAQAFGLANQVIVAHTASATRALKLTGSNGGAPSLNTTAGDLALNSATGLIQLANANSFSTNGSVATVLGSVGPSGSHTTVQTWLTFKDSGGTTRYVPCF